MSGLMSFEEAAEYLGIKHATLYKYTSSRKVPFVKVGRLVKFRLEDLDHWIDDRMVEPISEKKTR